MNKIKLNWCKFLINKLKSITEIDKVLPLQLMMSQRFSEKKHKSIYQVLERFNSLVNNHINNLNILEILRKTIIEDMEYDFYAFCLLVRDLKTAEIRYVEKNLPVKSYLIGADNGANQIINSIINNKSFTLNKNFRVNLGFEIDKETKNVIGIPISLNNRSCALLCAGKNSKNISDSNVLNLLSQQLTLILTNDVLLKKITNTDIANSRLTLPANADSLIKKVTYENMMEDLLTHLNLLDGTSFNSPVLLEVINSLVAAIDAKDSYTQGHSQAVSLYAEQLAMAVGLPSEELEKVRIGALMHDIGKIGIPEIVLDKPAALTEDEWLIMKKHPEIGARRILQPISALRELIPIVETHHERCDGTGYPFGLKDNDIPLGAKIVSIVDAFHTMTTDRPYRQALGYDKAVRILGQGAGMQWDRTLVRTFIHISKKAHATVQNNKLNV